MKQPFIAFTLVLLTTIIFPRYLFADTFTVYTEPLAPLHYEQDKEITGIATDIVREIFRVAGHQAQIKIFPWKRAYKRVQQKPSTFIFTLNRTEKREQLFKWIGPILHKRTYLYAFKDRDDIQLESLDDAKKYMTAVILGHSLTTALEDGGFEEGVNIVKIANKSIQVKVFAKKRCDLITGNEYTILPALHSVGLSIEDVKPVLHISSGDYYIGAHPDTHQQIIHQLQQAADTVTGSGFVERTVNSYME
ncbi:MAG: hypothetical protein D6B25_09350 [Desulfobulbaceae bacterium]|nr:MAG: hypothetical protein D6B25_09350 [Desulfobulbaceae bacterium]